MSTLEQWLLIAAIVVPVGVGWLIAALHDKAREFGIGLFVVVAGLVLVAFMMEPGFGLGELFGLAIFIGALGWVWFGEA